MDHGMKAAELFLQGYNCAQAVAVAFCDVTGLTEAQAAKMVSGSEVPGGKRQHHLPGDPEKSPLRPKSHPQDGGVLRQAALRKDGTDCRAAAG